MHPADSVTTSVPSKSTSPTNIQPPPGSVTSASFAPGLYTSQDRPSPEIPTGPRHPERHAIRPEPVQAPLHPSEVSRAPSTATTPRQPPITDFVALPPRVLSKVATTRRSQNRQGQGGPFHALYLENVEPDPEFGKSYKPSEDRPRPYIGSSHISQYSLHEKLGEGTFGVVWRGVRKAESAGKAKKGAVVALKEMIIYNEMDGMPITSLREIRILKALDHPNVVPVVDIAFEEGDKQQFKLGKTFMVFPYMDHDLAGLLENNSVRLNDADIKQYSKQLLQGTAYLHQNGILHRDMKAANLLINNEGTLMIADFGLARSIHKAELGRDYTNCVVTRWYRPPELLLGERKYHTPVDMWGVGCVMVEMYKKTPLFPGASDLNQAEQIFALCGSPTEATMPGFDKLPGCEGHTQWKRQDRVCRNECERLGGGPSFAALIDKILVLDPKKRLTAPQALNDNWFWSDPLPTPPHLMSKHSSSHELDRRKRDEANFVHQQKQPRPPQPLVHPHPQAPPRPAQQPYQPQTQSAWVDPSMPRSMAGPPFPSQQGPPFAQHPRMGGAPGQFYPPMPNQAGIANQMGIQHQQGMQHNFPVMQNAGYGNGPRGGGGGGSRGGPHNGPPMNYGNPMGGNGYGNQGVPGWSGGGMAQGGGPGGPPGAGPPQPKVNLFDMATSGRPGPRPRQSGAGYGRPPGAPPPGRGPPQA
ncbi:hypothetical protein P7C70_g297, partial [Phenoliferia sp. Uapishka_3]